MMAAVMVATGLVCALAQAGDDPSPVLAASMPTTAPAGFVVSPGVVRAGKVLPWSASQPTRAVPRGLGVNIHFTDPKPGEMEMMAAAGVTIVRMDFTWNSTERVKGEYNFAHYDRLLDALDKHNMRLLAILDYGSPFYDDWNGPRDEATRDAFVAWVKAAVTRFKGRGVLWEMWNEPNLDQFWKPRVNADDYIQLALAVGKAMREIAPNEAYIGPATAGVDFPFLEACFRAGLLEYWDAVTVHPYRQSAPETTVEDYVQLGALIARHKPEGKYVPIISGEWGYSTGWARMTLEQQAKYLARQWLMNLACDVPVSIWYDWHDDGDDPKEPEHHFGTVLHEHREDRSPVYEPKPSYIAMKTLTEQLSGYTFDKRLWTGDENEWVLVFRDGERGKYKNLQIVAWRTDTASEPKQIQRDLRVKFRTSLGEWTNPDNWPVFTDTPQYVVLPVQPGGLYDSTRYLAAAPRLPWVMYTKGSGLHESAPDHYRWRAAIRPEGERLELAPIQHAQGAQVETFGDERAMTKSRTPLEGLLEGPPVLPITRSRHNALVEMFDPTDDSISLGVQHTRIVPLDPITAKALPVVANRTDHRTVKLLLENPSGEPFAGRVTLVYDRHYVEPVEFAAGQTRATVSFTLSEDLTHEYGLFFWLEDSDGKSAGFSERKNYARIRASHEDADALSKAWQTHTEGDEAIKRTFDIAPVDAPEGLGESVRTIKISYAYDVGHMFGKVMPRTDELKKLPAGAERLEMWVHGDGSGNRLRVRYVDSQGQTFQSNLGVLDFTGWRFLSARLDKPDAGYWGGPADGVVRGPIELDTLILIDKRDRTKPSKGEIHIALPQAVSPR